MASDVFIKKLNNFQVQVVAERYILKELADNFMFRPEGYKFMPNFKNRVWDGYVRMLSLDTGFILYGLYDQVKKLAESKGYSVEVDKAIGLEDNSIPDSSGYDLAELFQTKFEPRDYQNNAVTYALKKRRGLLLSPTGSGKSLIIYLLTRHLIENENKKVLIVVPTVSLVTQMRGDFIDYNKGKDFGIHTISAGESKTSTLSCVVSTWQSLMRVSKDYLSQYDAVIIDEAHLAKSASITKLLQKMPDVEFRVGLTGTIDDKGPVNKMTLEGLFGDIYQVTKTHKLIEQKTLADFQIKTILLQHQTSQKFTNYQEEIDFVVESQQRLHFIANLAGNLKGNTLILFNFVERHGIPIYERLKNEGKNVHLIHGGINKDEREFIRKSLEKSNDNILVASFGTTSTGTNIVNLDNLIFAHPTKSKIRNLQSIGRILRKNGDNIATLYDLVDCFSNVKFSYGQQHYSERKRQYVNEKFNYKEYAIVLKE